jgi:hypothetical protein
MKFSILLIIVVCLLITFTFKSVLAATTLPPANYDEAKVPSFTLPNPLVMLNGEKVKDVNTWKQKRRPEILKLFETNVYGRNVIGRPDGMTCRVITENRSDMNGIAITKTVRIYLTGKEDGPKMDVNITLPVSAAKKPVPVVAIVEWAPQKQWLLDRGYGLATFNASQIEPAIKKASANISQNRNRMRLPRTNGGQSERGRGV